MVRPSLTPYQWSGHCRGEAVIGKVVRRGGVIGSLKVSTSRVGY